MNPSPPPSKKKAVFWFLLGGTMEMFLFSRVSWGAKAELQAQIEMEMNKMKKTQKKNEDKEAQNNTRVKNARNCMKQKKTRMQMRR